jgi:aromatic ring hydroxylase
MLMTGKEYLQSIRDGRVIYVGKERVKDQTTHPAFADGARTYAALFDMKSDPAVRVLQICITYSRGPRRICGAATVPTVRSRTSVSV